MCRRESTLLTTRLSLPTESIPFLAVSRSSGDVWSYCEDTKQFAVSPEPDVGAVVLSGDDVSLILASDGLTDVLEPSQIAAIVDQEESVTQIGVDRSVDLVYRSKHTNLARVLVANAFSNWRHLISIRADNVTAIAVMLDSPHADLPVDHQCVEQYIGVNESIDKIFLDDPQCMIRISPTSTLKLITYRFPIIYRGARDPDFSVVDYKGPGFITHTEERLIEERYRSTFVDAEQGAGVADPTAFASAGTSGLPVKSPRKRLLAEEDSTADSASDNNSYNVSNNILETVRSGSPEIVESHEESLICAEVNSPRKRLLAEEDSTADSDRYWPTGSTRYTSDMDFVRMCFEGLRQEVLEDLEVYDVDTSCTTYRSHITPHVWVHNM